MTYQNGCDAEFVLLLKNNNKNGYLNNMQMIYYNAQLQINDEAQKLRLLFA